jgi:hypothetical protein
MGIDIQYFTKSSVTQGQIQAIVAASREPNDQPWLLCEPIQFCDMPGFEDRLFGASKLSLIPASEDRADAEEHYSAEKNDLQFLLDQLAEMSRKFIVDWEIQIEGAPVGSIDAGVCEPAVRDAIEAMAELSDELGEYGDLGDFM